MDNESYHAQGGPAIRGRQDQGGVRRPLDIQVVSIGALSLPRDPLRLAGEDSKHTAILAETDAPLPPILVHRQTMTIIDGMHRHKAAIIRGRQSIEVEFFDGSLEEAFLQAVKANTAHGLPLSMDDRRAAARKIITENPGFSDRYIAGCVGVSDKTIGVIRRSMDDPVRRGARVGVDGRVRPLSGAEGRERAADVIRRRPGVSIREIAEEAGVSIGTAHDVRTRMQHGEDPVNRSSGSGPGRKAARSGPRTERGESESGDWKLLPPSRQSQAIDELKLMESLLKDPALRQTENGRELLRFLQAQILASTRCLAFTGAVPSHRTGTVAQIARRFERLWGRFAQELELRSPDAIRDYDLVRD